MNISYNHAKQTVRQVLGRISKYDLEGEFENVINHFKMELAHYNQYLFGAREIKDKYFDGQTSKQVKFDSLSLEWTPSSYDDTDELHVIGERKMDASELAAWQAEVQKGQEREKEQLRKLKAKYPDV